MVCVDAVFDIIRAERRVGVVLIREVGTELSCGSGALEFVAEVLEVFRADLELQHLFDHRREVRERWQRPERRSIRRPRRTPRRRKCQRVLDCGWKHAAVIQLSCKDTIRTSNHARGTRRRTIRFENLPHILALFHIDTINLSPADRAATDR